MSAPCSTASPKLCPCPKSTVCTISSIARFAMTMVHVQLRAAEFGTDGPWLSFASQTTAGESGAASATRGSEAQAARPKLSALDKLFWVLACRFWTDWKRSLLVVTPETVVRWHRAGFQLYRSWISRAKTQVGRKKLSKEGRELIFRTAAENPTWGGPRIHGELLMLGFAVSERTVSRWMQRDPTRSRARQTLAFVS